MKPSTLYGKFFSLMLCKVYFSVTDDALQMWISFQGFIMTLYFFYFFFLIMLLTDIECQCSKVLPLQGMYFDDLLQIYKHKSPL